MTAWSGESGGKGGSGFDVVKRDWPTRGAVPLLCLGMERLFIVSYELS